MIDKKSKDKIRLLHKDRKELYKLQDQLKHDLWVDNLDNSLKVIKQMLKIFKRSETYTEKDFHINKFDKTFKE